MGMKFGIFDWALNRLCDELEFDTFEDTWGFIWENFPDEDEDDFFVFEIKN